MNILHISPYYPDIAANHAGGQCMGKEIDTLQADHNVYVLTFISQEFDKKLAKKHEGDPHYEAVPINRFTRLIHTILQPWMPYYFAVRTSLRFSWKLYSMVKKYHIDAIHAEYASMGQYLWIRKFFPDLKFNIIEHDATVQSYRRKAAALSGLKKVFMEYQLSRIIAKERSYLKKADHVLAFNDKDCQLLKKEYGLSEVIRINTFFGDLDSNECGEILPAAEREPNSICFLGQMARPENEEAGLRLIRIAEKVSENVGDLKVYIVGNKPSDALKKAAKDAVEKTHNGLQIDVTGFVDEVEPYLKRSMIGVFPLCMGAGIKVKVLKCMALGTTVITGEVGAEGIDEDGKVLLLANSDEEYAEEILACLKDPSLLDERNLLSAEFIQKEFNWERTEVALKALY